MPATYKRVYLESMTREALEVEAHRLSHGLGNDEIIQGTTICDYYIACDGDASRVLARAKEAAKIVNRVSLGPAWPDLDEWRNILPQWFVDACISEDEVQRDVYPDTRTFEEQRAAHFRDRYSLGGWLYWLELHRRQWLWFDVKVRDANTLLAHIDRLSDPFDLGDPPGVWWLFAAAGAKEYDDVGMENREDMIGLGPTVSPIEEPPYVLPERPTSIDDAMEADLERRVINEEFGFAELQAMHKKGLTSDEEDLWMGEFMIKLYEERGMLDDGRRRKEDKGD